MAVFGHRESKTYKPIPTGHPVTVIAAFNTDGDLIPRRFSFEDDRQEIFRYDITAIRVTKDKPDIKLFYCTYLANGYTNDITLCFYISQTRWTVG